MARAKKPKADRLDPHENRTQAHGTASAAVQGISHAPVVGRPVRPRKSRFSKR